MTLEYFTAFGLTLESDLHFPELSAAKPQKPDVTMRRVNKLPERDSNRSTFILYVDDVADFLITDGKTIDYCPYDNAPEVSLRMFTLCYCFAVILQQRGYIILHGNAISKTGQYAEIYVGKTGAGKSTLSAWYYQQGAKILTDDMSAIFFDESGTPYVIPSYPKLRIWQDAANLLKIETKGLHRVRAGKDKFGLPVDEQYISHPIPVTRVIEILPDDALPEKLEGEAKLNALQARNFRFRYAELLKLDTDYKEKVKKLADKVTYEKVPRKKLYSI